MADQYFGFDLDDGLTEMWDVLERVQDGGGGHRVAFKGNTVEEAARRMADSLIPFIESQMYPSGADGDSL